MLGFLFDSVVGNNDVFEINFKFIWIWFFGVNVLLINFLRMFVWFWLIDN